MTERWQKQTAAAGIPRRRPASPWARRGQFTVPESDRVRKWLLVAGILAVIAGVAAIAVPIVAWLVVN